MRIEKPIASSTSRLSSIEGKGSGNHGDKDDVLRFHRCIHSLVPQWGPQHELWLGCWSAERNGERENGDEIGMNQFPYLKEAPPCGDYYSQLILPGMPHLQYKRFSCRSWPPSTGAGDMTSSLISLELRLRDTRVSAVRNVLGNAYLSSLTKKLWYEEREQLDSGGGSALSQNFFDSTNLSAVSLEKSGKYEFLVN